MSADQLSIVFGALADPTRRAILASLAGGERTVAELGEPFPISQPAVSKHLRVLEVAGLITRSRRGTARLSRLRAEPLRDAAEWLSGYREHWDQSYERLLCPHPELKQRDEKHRNEKKVCGTTVGACGRKVLAPGRSRLVCSVEAANNAIPCAVASHFVRLPKRSSAHLA